MIIPPQRIAGSGILLNGDSTDPGASFWLLEMQLSVLVCRCCYRFDLKVWFRSGLHPRDDLGTTGYCHLEGTSSGTGAIQTQCWIQVPVNGILLE